jgi:hypothetical protein
MSAYNAVDGKVNNPMKSDTGRKVCPFVCRMTLLFDTTILNIKLERKSNKEGKETISPENIEGIRHETAYQIP